MEVSAVMVKGVAVIKEVAVIIEVGELSLVKGMLVINLIQGVKVAVNGMLALNLIQGVEVVGVGINPYITDK